MVKIKTVEIPEKRSPMKALEFVKATR